MYELYFDYYDSAENASISKARALRELARHGLLDEAPQLFADLGERDEYDAQEVLVWLGY